MAELLRATRKRGPKAAAEWAEIDARVEIALDRLQPRWKVPAALARCRRCGSRNLSTERVPLAGWTRYCVMCGTDEWQMAELEAEQAERPGRTG